MILGQIESHGCQSACLLELGAALWVLCGGGRARVDRLQQSLGARTVTSRSGCGAVAWSARRLWASSGPPGGRIGQAAGRQRLCELAGGVRSPPRRPPACPRAAPVDAALPTHPRHTRARARTHSGGGCNGVGGHTVVTKKCARSLWLLTEAQRLPLLGLGRPPAFRGGGGSAQPPADAST